MITAYRHRDLTIACVAGALVAGSMMLVACGSVRTRLVHDDQQVRVQVNRFVESGSATYRATGRLVGTNLKVVVSVEETCQVKSTPVYRRRTRVIRTAGRIGGASLVATELFWGAVAGGLGWLSLGDATNNDCSSTDEQGVRHRESAAVCYALGGLYAGGSVAMFVAAGVEVYRLRDSRRDDGIIYGETETRSEPCGVGPARQVSIIVRFGHSQQISATTSEDGRGVFSLLSVPESVLEGTSSPELLVNGRRTALRLAQGTLAVAALELARVPTSRVARDRVSSAAVAAAVLRRIELALARGDTRGAYALVTTHWRVASATKAAGALKKLARKAIVDASSVAISRRGDVRVGVMTLCYGRRLFVRLYGQQAWQQLRDGIASNAADIFAVSRRAAMRRLEGGRCGG